MENNPLMKFCRRFWSFVTLLVSIILLIFTILFNSTQGLEAYFFKQSPTLRPLNYCIIFTSVLHSLASILSLSIVPSTNLWVTSTSALSCVTGILIDELVKYVTKYDLTKSEFQVDSYLITWLVMVFSATLLGIISTIFAFQYERHVILSGQENRMSLVNQNPAVLRSLEKLETLNRCNPGARSISRGTLNNRDIHSDYTTFM